MRNQKKNKKQRAGRSRNVAQGDIPPVRKYDNCTISCPIPRVSETFTMRSTTVQTSRIIQSATVDVRVATGFTLADLDDYASYTSVFDQYRIDAVTLTIHADNNAIGLVTNSTTTLSPLYIVIDYDNNTTPSTVNTLREYDNCMVVAPGESAQRTFKPHAALAAYAGAFTSYANVESEWLDCASPSVLHFGYKYAVPAGTTGQTQLQSWIVERTYWVTFRRVAGGN